MSKEKKKLAKIRKLVQENTEINEGTIEIITDNNQFIEVMKEFASFQEDQEDGQIGGHNEIKQEYFDNSSETEKNETNSEWTTS